MLNSCYERIFHLYLGRSEIFQEIYFQKFWWWGKTEKSLFRHRRGCLEVGDRGKASLS